MRKSIVLLYGLVSYAVGLASLVYMMGWLGNIAVPRSIDSEPASDISVACLINLALFTIFALQHSVMARPWFKERWTKVIPEACERSTYVLFSGIAMLALMMFWQPMGGTIWHIASQPIRCSIHTIYLIGWIILVGSTFALNHFDLFGLRAVWLYFTGKPYTPLDFATPGPYRMVRHPLYVGWITLAWATPEMTAAHMAFAVATTVYILVAIVFEERDLVEYHGEAYERYRQQTPMLIPSLSGPGNKPRTSVLPQE